MFVAVKAVTVALLCLVPPLPVGCISEYISGAAGFDFDLLVVLGMVTLGDALASDVDLRQFKLLAEAKTAPVPAPLLLGVVLIAVSQVDVHVAAFPAQVGVALKPDDELVAVDLLESELGRRASPLVGAAIVDVHLVAVAAVVLTAADAPEGLGVGFLPVVSLLPVETDRVEPTWRGAAATAVAVVGCAGGGCGGRCPPVARRRSSAAAAQTRRGAEVGAGAWGSETPRNGCVWVALVAFQAACAFAVVVTITLTQTVAAGWLAVEDLEVDGGVVAVRRGGRRCRCRCGCTLGGGCGGRGGGSGGGRPAIEIGRVDAEVVVGRVGAGAAWNRAGSALVRPRLLEADQTGRALAVAIAISLALAQRKLVSRGIGSDEVQRLQVAVGPTRSSNFRLCTSQCRHGVLCCAASISGKG